MAKVTLKWSWVATALTYDIEYKKSVDSVWIPAAGSPLVNPVSGPEVSMQIDNLDNNTLYDFRVRSNCAGGYQSAWEEQSKSTDVNANVTLSVVVGGTGNEVINAVKFSVGGIDSGFVLPAPIVAGDSETYPLQASTNYTAILSMDNNGVVLEGSLRVYVNGVQIQCAVTSGPTPPADFSMLFNCVPGDLVLIEWVPQTCAVP